MPLDDRMHAHKPRPPSIRDVKPFAAQLPTMRVRPPRTDENGLDLLVLAQVVREGFLHAARPLTFRTPPFIRDVNVQREMVPLR